MKSKSTYLLLSLITVFLLFGCSTNGNNANSNKSSDEETIQLTISAAVSLTDALEEIKELYEQDHAVDLIFNLAGSGTLAQQIQQGAPSDIFISANQDWMDILEKEELIIKDTRTDVTGNTLVLITNESSSISYQSFDEISPIDLDEVAIGNPESVPAGAYTEEVLQNLDIWDKLEEKIVLAKDVRQVLTYVESGNADIGFVYESDALSTEQINILATADEGLHDPIIYPMALVADTNQEEEAKAFANFLETEEAQEILKKHGFTK